MPNILECFNISKRYRATNEVLSQLSLSVRRGELITLMGPNGAGKTTFIRIMTTQLLPSAGSATINGYDVIREAKKVRGCIALAPQEALPSSSITPWEYVYCLTKLEGVSSREAKERTDEALKWIGLRHIAKKPCFSLSGGEKRRTVVASALASKAEVLFLDEPTAGLDPLSRRQVWGKLREIVNEGKTIILTTHLLDEAEIMSDKVAILNKGKLLVYASPNQIKASFSAKVKVLINGKNIGFNGEKKAIMMGDKEIIYTEEADSAIKIAEIALKKNVKVEITPVTFEDVFIKLLGDQQIEDT